MWYVSGNRDEDGHREPRTTSSSTAPGPRTHLSFGFGIHRCVGMRLAELQLKIVWQEMLKRFDRIEVVGEPKRVYSSFVQRHRIPAGAHSSSVNRPALIAGSGPSLSTAKDFNRAAGSHAPLDPPAEFR